MKLFKEIMYILTKEQKIKLFILLLMIIAGTFAELLGVTSVLPAVQVVLTPGIESENAICQWIMQMFKLQTKYELLMVIAIGIIIVFVVKNIYLVFMYVMRYQFIYNNQKRLAVRLMKTYMRKPYIFHLSSNTSELQRNVNIVTGQFFEVILEMLQTLTDVLLILVLFFLLLYKDVMMTLITMAFVLLFMVTYYAFSKKKICEWGRMGHVANARMIQWVNQAFEGIKEIKITHKEKMFEDSYEDAYDSYITASKKRNICNVIPKYLLETVSISGVMLVIIIKVLTGSGVDTMVENLAVFALAIFKLVPSANRMNGSVNGILFYLSSVHTVCEGLKRLNEEDRSEEKEDERRQNISFNDTVAVRQLWYRYPNMDNYVLENVNLMIEKGQSIAFIGESGAGKSTIADLILGILKPEQGEILVDGVNILNSIQDWHKLIGYIPQSIYLLDDTIRNNVAFGIPEEEIDDALLWKALEQAQLVEFVQSLEKGVDTFVGERGTRISGGQRQRIGIARALYHNPELLVLDEATSALDNDTEKAVMEAIEALQGTKTLIIIAHRLSTIEKCDVVFEVKDKHIMRKKG